MKRSSSETNLEDDNINTKRLKSNDQDLVLKNQEYLQLVLTRIDELQQQIRDDYDEYDSDETSDLGDSEYEETDEDIMDEVVNKIFEDFPVPITQADAVLINSQPTFQSISTTDHSMELEGFKVCRKVAVNFIKNVNQLLPNQIHSTEMIQRCSKIETDFEARKQMVRSFDLHLAAKERDYAARLTGE